VRQRGRTGSEGEMDARKGQRSGVSTRLPYLPPLPPADPALPSRWENLPQCTSLVIADGCAVAIKRCMLPRGGGQFCNAESEFSFNMAGKSDPALSN